MSAAPRERERERERETEEELEQRELRAIRSVAEFVIAAVDQPPPELQFQPHTETEQMNEVLCTKCGKKLRSDNRKGACADKAACSRRAKGGASPAPVRATEHVTTPADVEQRFNLVIDVLGFDRDQVLRELMQRWLFGLKASVQAGSST